MKNPAIRSVILPLLLIAGLAVAAAPPVHAQESSEESEWEFNLTIYGWLPQIYGHLNYEVPGSGDTIKVDPSTLLDNLGMTFQGAFEMRKNKWSLLADLFYAQEKAGASEAVPLPGEGGGQVNVGADLKLDMWLITLAGAYEVANRERATCNVLLGCRRISMAGDLDLSLGDGQTTIATEHLSRSAVIYDGIVGIRGRLGTKEKWYVPYHLDIGTGSSNFTWQGMTGIGYNWKWGGVLAAYRYLYFDQGDQKMVEDLALGGGAVGVHFNW